MAKKFDIYLRQQLTECDLILQFLTYRNGISVINRIILDCRLNDCLFYIFAAVQTRSELVAAVDQTVKRCLEQIDNSIEIGASGANVNGTQVQKFEAAQSVLGLSSQLIESVIQFADPENIGVVLDVLQLETKARRYRLLSELDGFTLDDLDDMSIEEIDFVDLP